LQNKLKGIRQEKYLEWSENAHTKKKKIGMRSLQKAPKSVTHKMSKEGILWDMGRER
jgi:hypothetical protein